MMRACACVHAAITCCCCYTQMDLCRLSRLPAHPSLYLPRPAAQAGYGHGYPAQQQYGAPAAVGGLPFSSFCLALPSSLSPSFLTVLCYYLGNRFLRKVLFRTFSIISGKSISGKHATYSRARLLENRPLLPVIHLLLFQSHTPASSCHTPSPATLHAGAQPGADPNQQYSTEDYYKVGSTASFCSPSSFSFSCHMY